MSRDEYRRAGVDVSAGERAVELMRADVEGTFGATVIGAFGGFAAAARLPEIGSEPLLVMAADGVGTKAALAARLGRYDGLGQDLVAMCVDDVVCLGARPLYFLDYLATDRLEPEVVAEIVRSIAAGCRRAGCALVGGETAEHRGLLGADGLDLAGFCVGVVPRDDLLAGDTCRPGDTIIGIAAHGLHANGFSLVRAVVAERGIDLSAPYGEVVQQALGPAAGGPVPVEPALDGMTFGQALLEPTPIYAPDLLALRDDLRGRGADIHGLAHVTGGGLPGNMPRALPPHLAAEVDPRRWPVSTVLRCVAALAELEPTDMRATFHGGLGMVVVVDPADAESAMAFLGQRGLAAWSVGEVVDAGDAARYREVASAEATPA